MADVGYFDSVSANLKTSVGAQVKGCLLYTSTPDGEKFFRPFVTKFFSYTDRTTKTPSEKLITKWLNEVKNKN